MVMEAVRSKLSGAAREAFAQLEGQLWSVVDEVIQLSDCEIYRCVCGGGEGGTSVQTWGVKGMIQWPCVSDQVVIHVPQENKTRGFYSC